MAVIQKNNVTLKDTLLGRAPEGRLIANKFFTIDADGHAVIPGPTGATIIKSGMFKLTPDGHVLIPNKWISAGPPGSVCLSGEILLIDPDGMLGVSMRHIPSARTVIAREREVEGQLLIKAHGGVGDIVCAEPAIRFAVERFKDQKIYLCTDYPEFFQHLKFENIFPASGPHAPDPKKFLLFQNFDLGNELAWEFVSHPLTHAVDYASLNMWRLILPNHLKEIVLRPTDEQRASARVHFPLGFFEMPVVVVHPGRTWDSRTFPKKWWDAVLATLVASGVMPVIIGGQVDKQADGTWRASTVEINTEGCLDLRGKLSFIETTALLQEANVLLTNDSSPLHIAASGNAWIGFVSTVKDASHLFHWRQGEFGWRMKDFAEGNIFSSVNFCPNQKEAVHVDQVHIHELLKWLPDPKVMVQWALAKLGPPQSPAP